MVNMDEVMTKEEIKLIDRLKLEMLNAVSIQELHFYKKEMTRVKERAIKRHTFLNKLNALSERL